MASHKRRLRADPPSVGDRVRLRGRSPTGVVTLVNPETKWVTRRFIPDIVWEVKDEYEARRGSRVEDRSAKREELAVAINNLCRLARAKQCREDAGVVEAKSQGEVRGIIVDPSVPLPDRQKWFADQQTHRSANEVSTALLLDAAATIRARAAKLEKLP